MIDRNNERRVIKSFPIIFKNISNSLNIKLKKHPEYLEEINFLIRRLRNDSGNHNK